MQTSVLPDIIMSCNKRKKKKRQKVEKYSDYPKYSKQALNLPLTRFSEFIILTDNSAQVNKYVFSLFCTSSFAHSEMELMRASPPPAFSMTYLNLSNQNGQGANVPAAESQGSPEGSPHPVCLAKETSSESHQPIWSHGRPWNCPTLCTAL